MDMQRPARAYSYVRFSTPEQAKGHSLQRQTDAARAWAAANEVVLDDELTFQDRGVSGFTGANVETGALGTFLERVKDGTIPRGSWLLVENLDRISRQAARKAVRTIEDIVEAGVTVVDMSDGGREYSAETLDRDPMLFLMMVVRFIRSNEESVTKSARVASAHAQRRQKFASQEKLTKPYTLKLPAWIRWSSEQLNYELIEDRSKRLVWMFELAAEGEGAESIAKQLNDAGVDTWGAGGWKAAYWHKSYIRKLLTNKAAIGIFVPHRVTRSGGKVVRTELDAIAGRFPAAASRELFDAVNDRLATSAPKGRNAAAPVRNIFSGVMHCECCGGTVTRINKGEHIYLACSVARSKAGVHRNWSVPYDQAVQAFRRELKKTLRASPVGDDMSSIIERLQQLEVEIDAGHSAIAELMDIAISERSKAARKKLQQYEAELEALEREHRTLSERRDARRTASVSARLGAVRDALTGKTVDVAAANKALRGAIKSMVMHPHKGTLDIQWHHAEAVQDVQFITSRRETEEIG
ncbi:recombinase family protein [Bradyrhizobium sp. McL0616]|uniref:recombinase family protein n=1 Tax=Bradyrhizobium sp. McL0616 TaxID=3415674 RepID=UPI003CF84A13